jgi:large subunit ribosomal protein L15
MRLSSLPKIQGSTHRTKRRGCGRASGHGKTSCRGSKGGKARSGYGVRPGFEGGQTPLWMRIPKRGFTRTALQVSIAIVNLGDLVRIQESEINRDVLVRYGLVRANERFVKLLGDGVLDRNISVKVHFASKSAISKVEALGGKIELIA